MALELPPWLQTGPRDFVAAGERGMQAGLEAARTQQAGDIAARNASLEGQRIAQSAAEEQAQIGMEHARLDQQAKQASMAMQAEKEQAQRDFDLKTQQQNVAAAYHQATIGIQKAKLEDARAISARKYAAQQKLQQLTQAGVPYAQAVMQVDPVLWTAGMQTQMVKTGTGTTQPKMTDIDAQDRRLAMARFMKANSELQSGTSVQDPTALRREMISARDEMNRIAAKYTGGAKTATGAGEPTVTTQEQFDALQPGAIYKDKDGKRHQKPGQPAPAQNPPVENQTEEVPAE